MNSIIASSKFQAQLDYASLPKDKLIYLFHTAMGAHANFFGLWRKASVDLCGEEVTQELSAIVYPNLASYGGDVRTVFYEELNFISMCMPDMASMLTVARYEEGLLPPVLNQEMELDDLSSNALVLLWNLATLTYVMQTSRWTETLRQRFNNSIALRLEKEVWVDHGGAEDDINFGLTAIGETPESLGSGNVETLLRGFQYAPGEVCVVDAEFKLESPDHGWITHKYCPAHDMMRDTDKERLENCCMLCVISMRLSGELVNKNIRCRPASLPPHKVLTGHACQWEYWAEGAS